MTTTTTDAARWTVPSLDVLARLPDDAIDVVLGAALIAKDVYPTLDPSRVAGQLAKLAEPPPGEGLAELPLSERVARVAARFVELGFRGNVENYQDPKNSLLPDVLERRLGIPITLSLVFCEMARRSGVRARGVGFPGHFLVRVDGEDGEAPIFVDPFERCRVVNERAMEDLLRRALGPGAELRGAHREPASPRDILVRMLANLKSVWASRGDHVRAFVATDRIVTLLPDSARMLRERAGVALKVGAGSLARADFERVLALEPEAPDVPQIRARLARIAQVASVLH